MMAALPKITVWVLALLALALAPLLGLLTPYVALLVIIPLFFVTLFRGQFLAAYRSYDARAFLGVFVVLAVLFALSADAPGDILHALNFTMLLAYGAVAWLFTRRAGLDIRVEWVPQLAGIAVLGGFATVVASAAMGTPRATGINIGPIVLSNGLLALGFISLGGALLRRDRLGWLYLLPPVLAIVATLITTSRGPLIAVPVLIVAAAIWFWRARFGGNARIALLLGGAVVAVGAVLAIVFLNTRMGSIIAIVEAILRGDRVGDHSTYERLLLYRAGIEAFMKSPWIGYGWANIMDTIRPLLPAGEDYAASLPQLHNDVLNFAVAGGVIGVLCYIGIITTPLIGAWLSPRDGLRNFRLYGATMLTIVYVGGGLTDLMFGFEFHTYLFTMLTAVLLGLCRARGTP